MQTKMNLIIIGDAAVGKSSLTRKLDNKPHETKHIKTVAVDFITTTYTHDNGEQVQVKLWDTAGQERFRNITNSFYRQSDGIIVTFDITNEKSFVNLTHWINSIFKAKPRDIPIILVGNKLDLAEQRVISHSDVEKIRQQYGVNYHETSAMNGTGVTEMMHDVAKQVYLYKFDKGGSTAATGAATATGA